jgi:pimeloyl-ACP methyl ester carboxylesterase
MTDVRIHRAISPDGTEIAGRVQGQGPPLVLCHPNLLEGDIAWEALVPHLADRFTCYRPSMRGRGLSGDDPDHAPPRLVEDITAFVDSIGEPVCLVSWSDSDAMIGAAIHCDAVAAIAAFEPTVYPVMREDDLARFGTTIEQWTAEAAEGRLDDAARTIHRFVCTDDEFAALEADYLQRFETNLPVVMAELEQNQGYEGPSPTDPEMLGRITAPVLVLRSQQGALGTFFADSAEHIAEHVADGHVRELPYIGHFAPLVEPEPIAEELISFFESVRHRNQPDRTG